MAALALAAIAIALPLPAQIPADAPDGRSAFFEPNDRVSVSTEATLKAGVSALLVYCSARGASLYLDSAYLGAIPVSGGYAFSAAPGSHYLAVSLPGYYDVGIWLLLAEKTSYTITFKPARIMGSLSISVEPADASVAVDGQAESGKDLDLPIGSHRVNVKRFGYVEQGASVVIFERRRSYLSIVLKEARFEIDGLGFTRGAFNPRNAGAAGRTDLRFRATSYGSAVAEIHGPSGDLVATLDFPDIRTWEQSRSWDGLAPDGSPLPDGRYTAILRALPASGVPASSKAGPGGALEARSELRIDSSLVVRPFGTSSGVPGLLYMPDPLPRPAGTLAAEASWFSPWAQPQASAFGLSAALSFGARYTLALHAAAETGAPANAADFGISALASLFGDRTGPLSGAVFVKAGYSSADSPALPDARSAVEASFPLALRLGGLSLALSPGAFVDLGSGAPVFLGLARASLSLEGRSFNAGLSGELPVSFASGPPAFVWPARAALEGRLTLGSTPFVAAAFIGADLQPGAAPRAWLGLGLGLLF